LARRASSWSVQCTAPLLHCTAALHCSTLHCFFHPIPVELLLAAGHAAINRDEPVPEWLIPALPADLRPFAQQAFYYAAVQCVINAGVQCPGPRFPGRLEDALNQRPDLRPLALGMVDFLLKRPLHFAPSAEVSRDWKRLKAAVHSLFPEAEANH
jgi:hypothetical protein